MDNCFAFPGQWETLSLQKLREVELQNYQTSSSYFLLYMAYAHSIRPKYFLHRDLRSSVSPNFIYLFSP